MSKANKIGKNQMARNMARAVNKDLASAKRTWLGLRYKVLSKNDGRCQLCGRGKHDGIRLTVDHIKPRKYFPLLALDESNLQVLCEDCNVGKGSLHKDDWSEIMDWEKDKHLPIRQMTIWWGRCFDGHKAQFISGIGRDGIFNAGVMKAVWDKMSEYHKQQFVDLIVDELDVTEA